MKKANTPHPKNKPWK